MYSSARSFAAMASCSSSRCLVMSSVTTTPPITLPRSCRGAAELMIVPLLPSSRWMSMRSPMMVRFSRMARATVQSSAFKRDPRVRPPAGERCRIP